jgi:hypothetical protein
MLLHLRCRMALNYDRMMKIAAISALQHGLFLHCATPQGKVVNED